MTNKKRIKGIIITECPICHIKLVREECRLFSRKDFVEIKDRCPKCYRAFNISIVDIKDIKQSNQLNKIVEETIKEVEEYDKT